MQSDDVSLDELQEIVNYIKSNRDDIDALSISGVIGLQDALDLLVGKDADTGSAIIPSGDTASRGSGIVGKFRLNTETGSWEGYSAGAWGSIGGGATGGGNDQLFMENDQVMTEDYTIPAGRNAVTVGPIVFEQGVVLTLGFNSVWVLL